MTQRLTECWWDDDLIPAQNPGATYFAEAEYIVPHEYAWCQTHPGQCNMYNNASYQRQNVSGGPTTFTFSAVGSTVREQPAIMAWTGATVSQVSLTRKRWYLVHGLQSDEPNRWRLALSVRPL